MKMAGISSVRATGTRGDFGIFMVKWLVAAAGWREREVTRDGRWCCCCRDDSRVYSRAAAVQVVAASAHEITSPLCADCLHYLIRFSPSRVGGAVGAAASRSNGRWQPIEISNNNRRRNIWPRHSLIGALVSNTSERERSDDWTPPVHVDVNQISVCC